MGDKRMTTKMRIWDSLCKTNPDYTRSVPSSYGKKIDKTREHLLKDYQ